MKFTYIENQYFDAVDIVCMECCGSEDDCERCKVRETVDIIYNRAKNRKDKSTAAIKGQPVNVYGETHYYTYGSIDNITSGFGYKDEDGNITWYDGYEHIPDDEDHLSYISPYGNGKDLSKLLK